MKRTCYNNCTTFLKFIHVCIPDPIGLDLKTALLLLILFVGGTKAGAQVVIPKHDAGDRVSSSGEIKYAEDCNCLGWITNGSYVYYGSINTGNNSDRFRALVSSPGQGGIIEVRLSSPTGYLAGQLQVPQTGDWYQFVEAETSIPLISGWQDVYLVFKGGEGYLLNISWFSFYRSGENSAVSGPSGRKIDARNYTLVSGEIHGDDGCSCIGWITHGSYAQYNKVDFGNRSTRFRASVASMTNGGRIDLRLDSPSGQLIGSLNVGHTGDWNRFETVETSITPVSGQRNLWLVFQGGEGYLLNVAWFELIGSY